MASAFDFHVAGIRESVYALAAPLATRDLQFLPATHGDRAGLVGCAALALDHVLAPSPSTPGWRRGPLGLGVEPNTWLWILAGFLAASSSAPACSSSPVPRRIIRGADLGGTTPSRSCGPRLGRGARRLGLVSTAARVGISRRSQRLPPR